MRGLLFGLLCLYAQYTVILIALHYFVDLEEVVISYLFMFDWNICLFTTAHPLKEAAEKAVMTAMTYCYLTVTWWMTVVHLHIKQKLSYIVIHLEGYLFIHLINV